MLKRTAIKESIDLYALKKFYFLGPQKMGVLQK